jgi:hypothetical protein
MMKFHRIHMSQALNPQHLSPPSPSSTLESPTISEKEEPSALYQSVEEAIQHPSCVSIAWLDTVANLKNNPQLLNDSPYNDGSLHWVNKNNELLCMAFPAVLNLHGRYSKIGPYFSLMGDCTINVCLKLPPYNIIFHNALSETINSNVRKN